MGATWSLSSSTRSARPRDARGYDPDAAERPLPIRGPGRLRPARGPEAVASARAAADLLLAEALDATGPRALSAAQAARRPRALRERLFRRSPGAHRRAATVRAERRSRSIRRGIRRCSAAERAARRAVPTSSTSWPRTSTSSTVVLGDVADALFATSARDSRGILDLYERWTRRGSHALAEALVRSGVLPTSGSGTDSLKAAPSRAQLRFASPR